MIIDRTTLLRALAAAARIAPSRATLPVLANVLLTADGETLTVEATNLEIGLRQILTTEGGDPFSTSVDARKIAEVVGAMDGADVELTFDGARLTVKSGAAVVELQTIAASEFPPFPVMPDGETVDAAAWSDAVSRVLPAASIDEARPVLQGVCSDDWNFVATDGFRVHIMPFAGGQCIVPARALGEAVKLFKSGNVTVSVTDSQWFIGDGATTFVSQLIEGNFPDWRAIVPPDNGATIEADVARLTAGVKRVLLMAANNVVGFAAEDGRLTLVGRNSEVGNAEDSFDVKITGDVPVFALNGRFVLDALRCTRANPVRIHIMTAYSPVLFKDGSGWGAIIMPMAVQHDA